MEKNNSRKRDEEYEMECVMFLHKVVIVFLIEMVTFEKRLERDEGNRHMSI
jgi:hypothetical protein